MMRGSIRAIGKKTVYSKGDKDMKWRVPVFYQKAPED